MSIPLHPHYTQLFDLLRQEREEDQRAFLKSVRERPLADRVAEGYTWYPLNVLQTGFALGEKAYIVVERTTRLNEPHQLRAGQSVSLFTQAPHVKNPDKQGVINYVERNKMKIILNSRDVPDWLEMGQLGVDMLFDDRSYAEMERALLKVMNARADRLAELRDILVGKKTPRFLDTAALGSSAPGRDELWAWHERYTEGLTPEAAMPRTFIAKTDQAEAGLNDAQKEAVRHILAARDVAVVHGPPGTGKTTTLVAAIQRLCERESTVLVTAPSNTAADLLTERLAAQGLQVVRIGNISRVDDSVLRHTLEAQLARHPESKNLKKVKLQAAEYRRQARQHKRSFGYEERREREHLKSQARELEAWANTLENRIIDQILTGAQAITCTLVGAGNSVLEPYRFRTCVIDEAAQALEPACWIPISKCSRVVLAGDPFQLPPTVKSLEAARGGLSRTLIERCLDLFPEQVHLLNVQYRMHRAIMGFSNAWFYGGALEAHHTVAERHLYLPLMQTVDTEPVVFIDTAGCGFEEKSAESANRQMSRYNPEEALLIREHLLQLLAHFPAGQTPSIGILSPYREQVNYLNNLLLDDPEVGHVFKKNTALSDAQSMEGAVGGAINTIDGFQGQERDVVYISLVRSNPKNEIGFLSDYRRMNVAMTRARMLLIVIGDSGTIGKNKFYEAFLEYCERQGRYETAWQYLR
jgi:ATP-dependent RNA/DNA helicase IGHMBP2